MSAIILAGGKSERMGTPKADLRLGERTLLEWVVQALMRVSDDILLVTPMPPAGTPKQVRLITDEAQGLGPLAGICAGLEAARDELSFITGCDTPFLQPRLIQHLLTLADGSDAVIPSNADGLHPLCGVYAKSCLPATREALATGNRSIRSLFSRIRTRVVHPDELRPFDPELLSLFNVNTPDDFVDAEALLPLREEGL